MSSVFESRIFVNPYVGSKPVFPAAIVTSYKIYQGGSVAWEGTGAAEVKLPDPTVYEGGSKV